MTKGTSVDLASLVASLVYVLTYVVDISLTNIIKQCEYNKLAYHAGILDNNLFALQWHVFLS